MDKFRQHQETHLLRRANWLRAAVLGANDGILSTASIVSGMAAGGADHGSIFLAGLAGLVAGATSMATGEYVSVSSQSDVEEADLAKEKRELIRNPVFEQEELAHIYETRGLKPDLAKEVAKQLMDHDALEAHARDELGISNITQPNPLQAAFSSAISFTIGALLPLLTTWLAPVSILGWTVFGTSLLSLGILGFAAARLAGAPAAKPVLRIVIWGVLSMGTTALIGAVTGTKL